MLTNDPAHRSYQVSLQEGHQQLQTLKSNLSAYFEDLPTKSIETVKAYLFFKKFN